VVTEGDDAHVESSALVTQYYWTINPKWRSFQQKKIDRGFMDTFHTRTTVCVACSTLGGEGIF